MYKENNKKWEFLWMTHLWSHKFKKQKIGKTFKNRFAIVDPDSKVHGANMGPTWVLPAPDGPHVGPMILVI